MTDKEAMKLALEALESNCPEFISGHREPVDSYDDELVQKAITALRDALDQPEDKPVVLMGAPLLLNGQPLYTRPQPAIENKLKEKNT